MTPESQQRRIACIRKVSSRNDFPRGKSDRTYLLRIIFYYLALIIYFSVIIWRGILGHWF